MTDARDEDDMLAAEYAIGLLTDAERDAARARLLSDPAFAASVADWEVHLSQMADLQPVPPPAGARAAVMARLFPETVPAPLWQRVGLWQALTGLAAAAAVAIFFFAAPQDVAGPLYSAEIASEAGDFRVVALVDKRLNEVTLTRTEGTAPEGRILQVWAHGPGEPAQSVGLWPEGDTVRLDLPPEIAAVRGTLTLGVSEEPPGGSATGSPSGRVFGTVDIRNVSEGI